MKHFRFVLLLLVGAAAFAAASPAGAVKPIVSPAPPFSVTLPAGDVCSFPLTIETVVDQATVRDFFDGDGNFVREMQTGRFVVTATNEDTQASTTLNIGGPGTITVTPDGSLLLVGRGHGLLILLPTDSPASRALLITGRTRFTLDPATGQVELLDVTGTVRDLCALLS